MLPIETIVSLRMRRWNSIHTNKEKSRCCDEEEEIREGENAVRVNNAIVNFCGYLIYKIYNYYIWN